MPLKILHTESSTGWGGQEHRTFKEMVALRERGHDLQLACRPGARLGERAEEAGFRVHRISMRGGGDLPAAWKLTRLLRREGIQVVNTHSGHDSLLGALAGRLAGTPLIVRTRHLALPITSLATYRTLPHRVVTVSEWVRRYLISAGVPSANVATVYTGIEPPPPVEHSTLRQELGLAADDLVVGTVAILRYEKGHKELIDAAAPLLAEFSRLHLVFAGDGPIFDRLRADIAGRGLSGRIHLLGLRRDIPNVLAGCDFFALATWQEALGTSFIEAMAAGLAVVGTAVDGVPEVVRHGVSGLLVPAKDTAALTAALRTLVTDAALRRRFGQAGLEITRTRFSVATMAAEMEAFYLKSLEERRAA
ncbi:MAG TPA: glycosyltransferase [Rhodocyclaceae bacterium]|nr:glycosyltransferase [Rhodocyclaceae bacterium]